MQYTIGVLLAGIIFCLSTHAGNVTERKLSDYSTEDPVLRLEGKRADKTLSIPLAGRQQVVASQITLSLVSSAALIAKRSILNVRFNNATIGQIQFDPQRTRSTSTVRVPAELWRPGFNNLTLAVSQHYANQCVDGNAPELWSEIHLHDSILSIETEPATAALSLRALSGWFAPGIGGQREVNIVTPRESNPLITQQTLPLIAQALALRNQYVPLQVTHTSVTPQTPLPALPGEAQWDDTLTQQYYNSSWYTQFSATQPLHVLAGTKEDLAPYLSGATQAKITGAYIGVEATPEVTVNNQQLVAAGIRLVVSGRDSDEVRRAALTLALMDDELNPDADIVVQRTATEQPFSAVAAHVLRPDNTYSFAQMGQDNIVFRGEDSFTQQIALLLPADFYVPESASVRLNLDFGYGAALGPGSMMNILINDELVHGRPLDNVNGESYRRYQLTIPARHLQGGLNLLEFVVNMRAPLTGQPCDDVGGKHMVFQVRNTSTIDLPDAGNVATQPSLALFRDTGFPFARYQQSHPASVYLSSPELTGAGLTLLGKLAQTAGTVLPDLTLQAGIPKQLTDNAVVLATPETMPDDFLSHYEASLASTKQWPYRLQNELHNRIHKLTDNRRHDPLKISGVTNQQSSLGDMAVLLARKNPLAQSTGNLYLIAAQTPAQLTERMNDLVSLGLWGQLAGDFFSWEDSAQPLIAMQVAPQFELGEADNRLLSLRLWLSNNPWYWLLGLAFLIVLCTWLAVMLLKRRNQAVTEDW